MFHGWLPSAGKLQSLDTGLKQTVIDYVASLNRGEELRL